MARITATQRNYIIGQAVKHIRKVFKAVAAEDARKYKEYLKAEKVKAIDVYNLIATGKIKLGKKPNDNIDYSNIDSLFTNANTEIKKLRKGLTKGLETPMMNDYGSFDSSYVCIKTFKQCDGAYHRIYFQTSMDKRAEMHKALDDLYEELMIGDLKEAKELLAKVTDKFQLMPEYTGVESWWLLVTCISGIILCIWVIHMYNLVSDRDTVIRDLEVRLYTAESEARNYKDGFDTVRQQRDNYYKELMEYKMVLGDD